MYKQRGQLFPAKKYNRPLANLYYRSLTMRLSQGKGYASYSPQPNDDRNELVRIQRLAGVDFTNGKYNAKGHGLDGLGQSCYSIEWKRLKGVKTFSFQSL